MFDGKAAATELIGVGLGAARHKRCEQGGLFSSKMGSVYVLLVLAAWC